jgi:hypothetical protein
MREIRFVRIRGARGKPGWLAVCLLALFALAATPARSAEADANARVPSTVYAASQTQKPQAAYWRGRTCTAALCKSPRPGGIADVASFGLAAFGGAWISRRRSRTFMNTPG